MLAWFKAQVTKLVDFFVRPRNVGLAFIRSGIAVVGVACAGGIAVKLHWGADSFGLSTGEGVPAIAFWVLLAIGLFLIILGAAIAWKIHSNEQRLAETSRVLVVELRGLVDTSDHPLVQGVPKRLIGQQLDLLVDLRDLLKGKEPNVDEALARLKVLQTRIRQERGDTSRQHVTTVVGGVMQVPLLLFVGVLLDDEGLLLQLDWERFEQRWRELDADDGGHRFEVTGLGDVKGEQAVLAVSATYAADEAGITATFNGMSVVWMRLPDPKPNTLWSEAQQAALAEQFVGVLTDLANRGVKLVHLVLAASPSLAVRLGRHYDIRNHPHLVCYQWERNQTPAYPWGVQMPTATSSAGIVNWSGATKLSNER